jgi:hypothetical protein
MKINNQNYETYFLLYIDNELSEADRKEVALFIKEDTKYAQELALLSQAVLEPTHIEFEDKVLLYRYDAMEASLTKAFKEGLYRSEAPIVKGFFTSTRMRAITAVAAILILFVGYQYISNNVTTSTSIADNNNNKSQNTGIVQSDMPKQNNSSKDITSNPTNRNSTLNTYSSKLQHQIFNKESNIQIKEYTHQTISAINETGLAVVETNTHTTDIESNAVPLNMHPLNESTGIAITTSASEHTETFENLNTEDPDRTIYIANLEIDGDKLRGLTRRVSALLRRNKTEKEK